MTAPLIWRRTAEDRLEADGQNGMTFRIHEFVHVDDFRKGRDNKSAQVYVKMAGEELDWTYDHGTTASAQMACERMYTWILGCAVSQEDAADEIIAAHRLMNEAGLPATSGPGDCKMDLCERVCMIIALPQRRKFEERVAAEKERADNAESMLSAAVKEKAAAMRELEVVELRLTQSNAAGCQSAARAEKAEAEVARLVAAIGAHHCVTQEAKR